MRLTNTIRDAFVRAAMQDVPKQDFDAPAQKAFEDGMKKIMPKEIADIIKKGGPACDWIHFDYISTPPELSNYRSAAPRGCGYGWMKTNAQQLWNELEGFSQKKLIQSKQREELERKLKNVAYSCTTRKQLVDALPEFEKYLPEDEAIAIRTLPVVTNVVAEFVKAGWPTKKAAKK